MKQLGGLTMAVLACAALLGPGAGLACGQCEYELTVIEADWASLRGYTYVKGVALNEHGHIVGYYSAGDYFRPFLWTPEEGAIALPMPDGAYLGSAEDINDEGVIVLTLMVSGLGNRAFVYKDGEYTMLPPAQGEGKSGTSAINNKGEVVGTRSIADGSQPENAFFWSESIGFIDLGVMDDVKSLGWDLNDYGQLVGLRGIPVATDEAFLWDEQGLSFLGPIPDGLTSAAYGVNNRCQIVGAGLTETEGSSDPFARAFLWKNGVMTLLGVLPENQSSVALSVNDMEQTVGKCTGGVSGEPRAFFWQGGTIYDLNDLIPPGSPVMERARDINNQGQIVVEGKPEGGLARTYLLTPKDRPQGDVDCNCAVNVLDLLFVLNEWQESDSPADVNHDGTVDVLDLLIVLADWG